MTNAEIAATINTSYVTACVLGAMKDIEGLWPLKVIDNTSQLPTGADTLTENRTHCGLTVEGPYKEKDITE